MEDSEKIKQRFELLKMARELLNEDYINRRAEDHNKWVAENEESWRTTRRNVPYPPFAQYPTDDEIVRAASNLYNFIYSSDKTLTEVIQPSTQVHTPPQAPQTSHVSPTIEPIIEEKLAEPAPVITHTPVSITPTEIHTETAVLDDVSRHNTNTIADPLEVIKSLKENVPPTDPLAKQLIDGVIQIEESRRGAAFNVKKMLPGWVRRTTDIDTGSDNHDVQKGL